MAETDPATRLRDCKEAQLNVWLPLPLHGRLEALMTRLRDERGVDAYKRDLIAALILDAPEDVGELDDQVRRWKTGTAGDAQVYGVEPANVLNFRARARGRRPRQTGR